MHLTSRGRYATRAMVELARIQKTGPIPLSVIASCQNISRKYLQQLMSLLRRAGLVRVLKGNKGGFMLSKPPDQITIADILTAVEGDLSLVECIGSEGLCERTPDCQVRNVWIEATNTMVEYLNSVTLTTVLEKYPKKDAFDEAVLR